MAQQAQLQLQQQIPAGWQQKMQQQQRERQQGHGSGGWWGLRPTIRGRAKDGAPVCCGWGTRSHSTSPLSAL